MRAIDADRLKCSISQVAETIEKSEDDNALSSLVFKLVVDAFLRILDKTPTIPPVYMRKYDCNHDCEALYEAYQKGREDAFKEMQDAFLAGLEKAKETT